MDHSFFLPRGCRYAGSSRTTRQRPNGGAFSASSDRTNQGSSARACADFGDVALGVALTLCVIRRSRDWNHLAIHLHRGQSQGQLSRGMQAAARLRLGNLSSHRRSCFGQRFSIDHQA